MLFHSKKNTEPIREEFDSEEWEDMYNYSQKFGMTDTEYWKFMDWYYPNRHKQDMDSAYAKWQELKDDFFWLMKYDTGRRVRPTDISLTGDKRV